MIIEKKAGWKGAINHLWAHESGPATPSCLIQHLSCGQYLCHLPSLLPRACPLYPKIQGSSASLRLRIKLKVTVVKRSVLRSSFVASGNLLNLLSLSFQLGSMRVKIISQGLWRWTEIIQMKSLIRQVLGIISHEFLYVTQSWLTLEQLVISVSPSLEELWGELMEIYDGKGIFLLVQHHLPTRWLGSQTNRGERPIPASSREGLGSDTNSSET